MYGEDRSEGDVDTWVELRQRHREHLGRLDPIRNELNRYLSLDPLGPNHTAEPVPAEGLREALRRMREWDEEHLRIIAEYEKYRRRE
jgi:hypothetical protein